MADIPKIEAARVAFSKVDSVEAHHVATDLQNLEMAHQPIGRAMHLSVPQTVSKTEDDLGQLAGATVQDLKGHLAKGEAELKAIQDFVKANAAGGEGLVQKETELLKNGKFDQALDQIKGDLKSAVEHGLLQQNGHAQLEAPGSQKDLPQMASAKGKSTEIGG